MMIREELLGTPTIGFSRLTGWGSTSCAGKIANANPPVVVLESSPAAKFPRN